MLEWLKHLSNIISVTENVLSFSLKEEWKVIPTVS